LLASLLASSLASALLVASPALRAQDAEALLKEGRALMKEGKLTEACPKLEESQKLSPRAATLIEVAACHEKQGKIATAWSEYIDAEAEARKEGRKAQENDAKARSRKIEGRVPRVTVNVPAATAIAGLEVKIDGAVVEKADWGKSRPIDPGDHTITATAPGKKDWEDKVTIKVAEKKTVSVPALVDGTPGGSSAAQAKPPEKPAGTATTTVTPDPKETKDEPPKEPEKPAESYRKAGRWVVEVGVAGGALLGVIQRSSLPGLSGYDYTYTVAEGVFVDLCGDDKCYGQFDPAIGGYVGGQAFFGYAVSERLQFGGRVFGAPRIGGGFVILGGPSLSYKLDAPLWIGGTIVVGGVQQSANVTGIKGEVPSEAEQYNQGQSEVDVPPRSNTPDVAQAGSLSFGLAVELSYVIVDRPRTNWTSGALVVSAWPTFVKGLEGFAVAVPLGLSYKFY
jgi:hypothetical protein